MGRSRSSTPPRTSHTTVPSSSRNTWRGRRNGSLGGHHYPWYDIPPLSCDRIRPRSGSWTRAISSRSFLGRSPTVVVFIGCLVHGDGSLRHQVHCLMSREEREPFESNIGDGFKDGCFDLLFQAADGLLVHRSHPS